MDIDDILREVDPTFHAVPQEKRDLQELTRAWIAERSAPELLPWPPNGLFERINDNIKRQIEKVEEMTGDMDPRTNFALIVIQTELERFKYIVRSYLRARISKIDKHTLHYLSTDQLRSRLSEMELAYATRHQALLHNHYLSSFLSSFPPQMQNLNDSAGISMVEAPDLESAVFIRLLKDCLVEGRGVDSDGQMEGRESDVVILRWSDAKPLVKSGSAELNINNRTYNTMASPYTHIVLITGANQGLGYEIAKKLGAEHKDYHIIATGRRKESLDEAVKKLQSEGISVEGLVLDVTSDESIAEAVKTISEKHGRLDVLINNAGISENAMKDPDVPAREVWHQILSTNVVSTAQVTDALLPLLEKSQAPTKRIIFMSSTLSSLGLRADPKSNLRHTFYRAYSTSKTAMNMLAQNYVIQFQDDPTWKVNMNCPGYCATNLNGFNASAQEPAFGAINACRLATLGPDGPTGTFTNVEGTVPW
ncbi:DNA replication complex gins protein sld5 [Podospora australis]|uniref:DNA replication complex GINS protein SLD5 n=1 Tax=Podospora australis TaxID=1536484 RepID=A0AAN6X5Q7_9PEZI|nr:DNA replication complex gins protein sld5 [Podospora australis]